MKILHAIDNYLFKLFPNKIKKVENIIEDIECFYTLNGSVPIIEVDDKFIRLDVDIEEVELNNQKFQDLIGLCEQAYFEDAMSLAMELTADYPNVSEYHRILGQIYSQMGDEDKAIYCYRNALRWNPSNNWALIMMGDVYASIKNDINTAIDYYDQVLISNPDDFISLNNIGANLMQIAQYTKAIDYLKQAININPDYPNSYFALALIAEEQGNVVNTLDYALMTCDKAEKDSPIYTNAFEMAIACTDNKQNRVSIKQVLWDYTKKVEKTIGSKIEVSSEDEYFNMQKLMQALYSYQARVEKSNKIFISKTDADNVFFKKYIKTETKKSPSFDPNKLFESVMNQVYFTPINLFIDDSLYNDFPVLRTLQFLDCMNSLKEHARVLLDIEVVNIVDSEIISSSKIYSLINCLHFKSLFKIDLTGEFSPSKDEMDRADAMYKEFSEYREDREAGEEYEIIQNWAKDFKLDELFDLNDDVNL